MAFKFSAEKGLLSTAESDRAIRHLAGAGLPTHIKDLQNDTPNVDRLMELIAQDKKVKRGKLTFILVRGIGQAFVENDVDAAAVRETLAQVREDGITHIDYTHFHEVVPVDADTDERGSPGAVVNAGAATSGLRYRSIAVVAPRFRDRSATCPNGNLIATPGSGAPP